VERAQRAVAELVGGADLRAVDPHQVGDDPCHFLDAVDEPIRRLEREIRARAKPDSRLAALQALPGVGLVTVMTLVAEIGDVNRFPAPESSAPGPG
jgi:transposase